MLLGPTSRLSVSGTFYFHLCQPLKHRPSLQRGRCPTRGSQVYPGQVRASDSWPANNKLFNKCLLVSSNIAQNFPYYVSQTGTNSIYFYHLLNSSFMSKQYQVAIMFSAKQKPLYVICSCDSLVSSIPMLWPEVSCIHKVGPFSPCLKV